MNRVNTLRQLVSLVCYLTLQMGLVPAVALWHKAFCFVYVAFLLLLPWRLTSLTQLLFVGFGVGLLIDTWYDSWGLHAFASVLLVYCRALLLQRILPFSDYEAAVQPTLRHLGIKRFSFFALLLISIHHTALFYLDAYGTLSFLALVPKIFWSTLLTYTAVVLTQSFTLLAGNQ